MILLRVFVQAVQGESSGQGWGAAAAAQGTQSSLLPVPALLALTWDESQKENVVLTRDAALSPEAMLKSPVMCVRHTGRFSPVIWKGWR